MFRRINFQSIPVADQDRALAFYRDVMGLEVRTDAPYGENWRWIFMAIPGAETMIQFARQEQVSVGGVPALCLVSDDVDTEVARLKALDVRIVDGPADAPWHRQVRYALIHDSEDNLILIQSSTAEGA